MKTIYKFDSTGKCLGTITTSEDNISINIQNAPSDQIYIVDDVFHDWKDVYYKDETIKQKSKAPNIYSVWSIDKEQWIEDTNILKSQIISKRNQLLIASDWTQLPDVPQITKDMWTSYRQQLRDISNQPGFPEQVTWPQPPQ